MFHMIARALLCVCIFTPLWSEDIDLPDGYCLENYYAEDFGIDPSQRELKTADQDNFIGSQADVNRAMATLESGPSAMVANCVNAISGDFFESQIDLVVPCAHPIVVQRTYCSSEKKWHFQHMPLLEVDLSNGGHHVRGAYRDDIGAVIAYYARLRSHHAGEIQNEGLKIPAIVFNRGLTNCGVGEITGRTNWRNSKIFFLRRGEDKYYLLRHGSHVDRIFERSKLYGKKHRKGAPCGKFQLMEEQHPNGNKLQYTYSNMDDSLIRVLSVNRLGKTLGTLNFKQSPLDATADWRFAGGKVHYEFDHKLKNLSHVEPLHGVETFYRYDFKDRIINKILPEGRFLTVTYRHDCVHKGKVHTLLAPVGVDRMPITTHAFSYHPGMTKVKDAAGNLTQYYYHKEKKRLNSIIRYQGDAVYSLDHFYWTSGKDAGNLKSRTFEAEDKLYFCRSLNYDAFGNITEEQLIGNLSGSCSQPVQVDASGHSIDNGCEVFVKMHVASQDGWNLPLEEDDGRKQISFKYYSKTNLLKQRLTCSGTAILKWEFFEYDPNGVMIKEVWDDGTGAEESDLTGVSERHLKVIIPRTTAPIGLPQIVEEHYWDNALKTYVLVKKTVNTHSEQGLLLKEEHFDSQEISAYTLHWEYDHLGNVIKQVDALGQTTCYGYDANGNKIYEQGPCKDMHKVFLYDFSNRLIKEEEVWTDGRLLAVSHRYNTLSQRVATIDIYGQETCYSNDKML
jgi:YD repeat-containing protein